MNEHYYSFVFNQPLSWGMPREKLGERLRRLRKAAELTQDELAHEVGVSLQSISMIERGARKNPAPSTVRALAHFFDVDEQYILYGREIEPDDDWGELDSELVHFYRRLDDHAREALLQNARTLRELQGKYQNAGGEEHGELEPGPIEGGVDQAAHPVTPEIEEARRDVNDNQEA